MDPPGRARASRSRAFCVNRSVHNRGRIDIFDKKGNVVNRYAKNNLKKAVANGSDANVEESGARRLSNPNYQRMLNKRLNSGKAATEARARS